MDFKRNSIRFKSYMCSDRPELQVLLSDIQDLKNAAKNFARAQKNVLKDLTAWSEGEENSDYAQNIVHINNLLTFWTEAQQEYKTNLKEVKNDFEELSKSQKTVDKLSKELKELEIKQMSSIKTLANRKANIDLKKHQLEMAETKEKISILTEDLQNKSTENEILKSKKFKHGVKKYSESFLHLSKKCSIIFEAVYKVAFNFPEVDILTQVNEKDLRLELARVNLLKVKQKIEEYDALPFPTTDFLAQGDLRCSGPPPPYFPTSPNSPGIHPAYNINMFHSPHQNAQSTFSLYPNMTQNTAVSPTSSTHSLHRPNIGFHHYDHVPCDSMSYLNISNNSPPPRYENSAQTHEEQGAAGGPR